MSSSKTHYHQRRPRGETKQQPTATSTSSFPHPLIFASSSSNDKTSSPHHQQLPPPFFLHDNPFSLPALPYASRRDQPKSAIHWGQLKLFLSELQLLTQILPDPLEPHWIIYVGSAPGQHLVFLDRMFGVGTHDWELIDPGKFDPIFQRISNKNGNTHNNSRFTLRSEFFDNNAAYELMARRLKRAKVPALASIYENHIDEEASKKEAASETNNKQNNTSNAKMTEGNDVDAARKNPEEIPIRNVEAVKLPTGLGLLWRAAAKSVKTLFVSDVRSGQEDTSSFEEHVFENSMAQETWSDILQPTFAMLKFRLPYSFVRAPADPANPNNGKWVQQPCQFGEETLHLDGRVMLPLFARLTSTEARLIVHEGAQRKMYNHKQYEDHFFFFNSIFREYCHFKMPPAINTNNNDTEEQPEDNEQECLDHRFDCAAEAWVLYEYLTKVAPKVSSSVSSSSSVFAKLSVIDLATLISKELHGTIKGAAALNDKRLVELAEKTNNEGQIQRAKAAVARAQQFRNLDFWQRDVDEETDLGKKSSVWEQMLIEKKEQL